MGRRHLLAGLAVARRGAVALAAGGLILGLLPATVTSADVRQAPAVSRPPPLAGKVIGIDPGHNGLNYTSPAFLSRGIWNGREREGATSAAMTWPG